MFLQATAALNAYLAGKVEGVAASKVRAIMSQRPIATLETENLPANKPVSAILDLLKAQNLDKGIVRVDRVALVKVARHRDIVPTMKKLRSIEIDGQKLAVERFLQIPVPYHSDYEKEGEEEVFDEVAHRFLMESSFESDPARRFQLLRNQFERVLFDAKIDQDLRWLVDDSLPPVVQQEAKELLAKVMADNSDSKSVERLFDIYIQRRENLRFSKDFRELQIVQSHGHREVPKDDPMHWSQFFIDGVEEEEAARMLKEMRRLSALDEQQEMEELYGKTGRSKAEKSNSDADSDADADFDSEFSATRVDPDLEALKGIEGLEGLDPEELAEKKRILMEIFHSDESEERAPVEVEEGDGWEEEEKKLLAMQGDDLDSDAGSDLSLDDDDLDEDGDFTEEGFGTLVPTSLADGQGNLWSGVVIKTDVTSKTMPGNRVLSHRALVTVGNHQGTGGFGTGKGKGVREAINAAFRDALRNLVHVDLYDNFGFAHNLHGKHNSCQAYITATPRGRTTVGSNLAKAVLERMGVGSASVKFVGRRTPYSMTRALFNALSKHENIDEHAKMTGKRYLTLRWAKEHGL